MINISGSRSAATSGGNTAFSTAINAAASSAPRNVLTWTPGRISPDTPTATAPTNSASTRRSGRKRGRAAFHLTGSAYVASGRRPSRDRDRLVRRTEVAKPQGLPSRAAVKSHPPGALVRQCLHWADAGGSTFTSSSLQPDDRPAEAGARQQHVQYAATFRCARRAADGASDPVDGEVVRYHSHTAEI